ncbi:MAG: hypothetical protein NT061_03640 [Spirochaetes bacterium]|nr:hypothetical protein [Spirochaetota bacterium]
MRNFLSLVAALAFLYFPAIDVFGLSLSWEPQTGYIRNTLLLGIPSFYTIFSIAAPQDELFKIPDNTMLSAGLGTRIGNTRDIYADFSASASQAVGPDLKGFLNAWTFSGGLKPSDVLALWPTLDASLSLNLGAIRLSCGLRSDICLASAPNLPVGLAKGFAYSDTWFGESFIAWTRWYIGLRF